MAQTTGGPIIENARAMSDGPSLFVAYALWLFLGLAGAHRLYLGRPISALLQLVSSLLLVGILWWLVDALLLPGMVAQRRASLAAKPIHLANRLTTASTVATFSPTALANTPPSVEGAEAKPANGLYVADRLKALWDMRQSGALSDSEFNTQKAKLLAVR